ncbi:NADH-ubiquinone oxidoreductase B12 subunit family-domain-containing protein [Jimgerdemannia flammicorona]|uniref:NADH-ubiquinone oxidoreductase B12 subunit family-domain-containing protein n=2 Tax=Jimgerdemannia flammicorona TaxID=994334 RepID=A0A433QVE8_9FUNG|nr:NADH-ubiquinone oxidoreductase B12 subunit family-domain-containing protein [Jimgerdemannia flammicorona]RUS33783.1 NADH-ubiquinone oxidoreductase B12 subunit family-domain-containing protein [Jimgerdemannia flammicorona]
MPGKTHHQLQFTPERHDPWARREAWRKHAIFSNRTIFRNMFPGLGIATVAFAAYLGVEYVTTPAAKKGEKH